MQQLLRKGVLQAKMTVNRPGDPFEREADRIAETVMRMPDSAARVVRPSSEPPVVQRLCTECEEELHRKEASGAELVRSDFQHPDGGGRPLPDSDRGFFEPRFGRDFSQVRIHTGPAAGEAARSVDALAYTIGSDIVFGEGQYRPVTEGGRKLLAHELVHVIQQDATGTPSLQRQRPRVPSQAPAGMICPIATGSPAYVDTDVLFSLGSSTLTPTAIVDIASFVARWNAADADKLVRVDGYASIYEGEKISIEPVDPLAEIWTLSCDRAMMVEGELMSPSSGARGIPASFIDTFAQGETGEDPSRPPHTRATISADIPARQPAPSGTGCRSCPFFCSYDKSKPLETYNCSGLAFRTYGYHDLDETKRVLQSRGSEVSCGTPCDHFGMIKFWLWEYDAHREDSGGRVIESFNRDFHMVGGPTAGDPLPKDSDAFYSKNGARPVYGPGPAPSFRPPAREPATYNHPTEPPQNDDKGNPTYWVRSNLKESCYCFPCPKDLNDAQW